MIVWEWNISSWGSQQSGFILLSSSSGLGGRYCIIIKVRLRARACELHTLHCGVTDSELGKHFVRSEDEWLHLASVILGWDFSVLGSWRDRRWLLVMLSGLQQPDDRSPQSVGSSSYSADSGGGERVPGRLVQPGAGKMVRGQTPATLDRGVISSYPLLTLGHRRVFTSLKIHEEVMLHLRSSNSTIFINIIRAKTNQIYPDNIIIGYPSTHQVVGGKRQGAWGTQNIWN